MNVKNLIWLGETVNFNGKNAVVVDIDIPFVYLNIGESELKKVKVESIKKIHDTVFVDIRNN